MKRLSEVYIDTVIKPLEEEVKKISAEFAKKSITSDQEKAMLEKYDNLLFEKYQHLVDIIDEETSK